MSLEDQVEAVEASRDLVPQSPAEPALSIEDAAQQITDSREPSREIEEISYRKDSGERSDKKFTVSRGKATSDLAAYREGKLKAEELEAEKLVRHHVDELRQNLVQQYSQGLRQQAGSVPAQQPAQPQYRQQPQQPQSLSFQPIAYGPPVQPWASAMVANPIAYAQAIEAHKNIYLGQLQHINNAIGNAVQAGQPTADLESQLQQVLSDLEPVYTCERVMLAYIMLGDEEIASAYASPKISQHITDSTMAVKEVYEAKLAEHEADAHDLLAFTWEITKHYAPEFQHCQTTDDIDAVWKSLTPRRADECEGLNRTLRKAYAHVNGIKAQAKKIKREDFEQFRAEGTARFKLAHPECRNDNIAKRKMQECRQYLMSVCGLTPEQIDELAETDKTLVSYWGQETLYQATQMWLTRLAVAEAKATLPTKKVRVEPEPVVTLKPGSAESWASHGEPERLPAELSWRQGANVLINRRAKRR